MWGHNTSDIKATLGHSRPYCAPQKYQFDIQEPFKPAYLFICSGTFLVCFKKEQKVILGPLSVASGQEKTNRQF